MKSIVSNGAQKIGLPERAFIKILNRCKTLEEPLFKKGDGPLRIAADEMSRGNYAKAGPAFREAIFRLRECGKQLRADVLFNYAVAKLTSRAERHAENREIVPALGAILETVALLENSGNGNSKAFSEIRRNMEHILNEAKTGL